MSLIFPSIFGGMYFLAISALGDPGMGFPWLALSTGHQESEGRPSLAFLVSWGELGAGGVQLWDFWGQGWWGYVFALDMVFVTYEP